MSAKISICGLVGFPTVLVENFSTEEIARSLGVNLISCELNELLFMEARCDMLVFYVSDDTYALTLKTLREFIAQRGREHQLQFIVVTPPAFMQDLADAWDLGMYAYVPVSDQVDNLYYALNRFARSRRELESMEQQLKEASDIALLSMSASSQLGEIVRFMERSYQCEDYEQLGSLLSETLGTMGVSSCGVINSADGQFFFGDPEKQIFLERLIKEQQSRGRFVDVENRTTVNFEHVSVMARDLPEPGSEPYGRMKDVLFSLVEGADARIKAIASARTAAVMDRSKLNFLSVMSHELRTPMNSILGFAGRLRMKKAGDVLTERDTGALDFLQNNAQRLMSMIDNVFELTRMDSDAERARRRLLVSDVITGVIKKYEDLARAKKLQFELHWLEEGLNAELDPRRLQQIVQQLLDNAVKYTEHGKITVELCSVYRQGHGSWLQLTVADTGIGISESYQRDLFKAFGQVDDFMSRGSEGVHLGLALVNKFVNDQKGEIDVESTEGVGTTIRIRLPQFMSSSAQAQTDVELF